MEHLFPAKSIVVDMLITKTLRIKNGDTPHLITQIRLAVSQGRKHKRECRSDADRCRQQA
jgi:hypothetical protein